MIPLWLGVVPFGLAYAVTARAAGLGVFDTQLMSVAVFAGSAQFSAAGLFAVGATGTSLILTTFILNVRHLLYSVTLAQRLQLTPLQRLIAAHFLTDEAFGVAVTRKGLTFPYLLGTELSLFVVWNLSTLVGALLSDAVPDPAAIGVDFVFPLAFLALLVPLLRSRFELVIAVAAGLAALLLNVWLSAGLTILLVGSLLPLVGAVLTKGETGAALEPEGP